MLTNFSVRTTLPRRILSLTNIYVRIIIYDIFSLRTFPIRTFVITNFLHTYFIPYEHLYANFNVRTFTYVFLSDEQLRTNSCVRTVAYEHLHTNFFHTNFFYTNLCPDELLSLRIFYIRTIPFEHLHTNFSVRTFAYVPFPYEIYPLRTFGYEQLRTNFMHTNYFHTYFGPTTYFWITWCILIRFPSITFPSQILSLWDIQCFLWDFIFEK